MSDLIKTARRISLTDEAWGMLDEIAERHGLTRTAALEVLVRYGWGAKWHIATASKLPTIRTLIHLRPAQALQYDLEEGDLTKFSFWRDMPAPIQADQALSYEFIKGDGVPDGAAWLIYQFSFRVECAFWEQDEQGVYLAAHCIGE